ncbi:MAG: dicarboxylate/amino acid:cation symporter, partial [Bdellovibrionales bacterium]|nr:dicarboxylate/amino acid:cation symporter [Bdellovibrionales bacterium]
MTIKVKKPKGLTAKIIMAMLLGLAVGVVLNQMNELSWVQDFVLNGLLYVGGQIFISSLKVMVVPLVFVSLVCGTASLDDITKLGSVGGKTLALYLVTTAIAIVLALITATIVQPGAGFNLVADASYAVKEAPPLVETIINIFPSNPVQAMAEAKMLQIIVFAGLFGISLALTGEAGKRVLNFFNDVNEVIMKMVMLIMHIAPYGVFCLLAKVFAEQGIGAILPMGKYFLVVLFVLLLQVFLTYCGMIKFLARLSPRDFFRNFKDVPIFAFSTASSGATLPVTLEAVEHKLGVDNTVASFTIPLGATINMDGTAVMQGVATLFIAQA